MDNYYSFVALALLSEIIGTVSGFGSSILFVPVASLFFDFKSVLGITAVFHVFSNLAKIYLFRQGINKTIAWRLGLPAIAFVLLGAWLTTYLPAKPLEAIMSIGLIGLSIYLMLNFNRTIQQSNGNLFVGGAASGFLAGVAGTGGAVRGITLAAFQLPKVVFIATSAFIDLGVDTSRAVIYVSNGYFDRKYLVLIPFLIAISIVGSYLGKVILKYASEIIFRYMVLTVVTAVSLFQLVKLFT
ncbi:hypothetical protein CKK33_03785 [Mucilaginibacter sp. MD40]|uniref:sulfite exporter TauE/SafE family protein n=1 Tax=Mucilaginibacter sp. MD40 TaxID=2029590 RepID=UPI000BACDA41|nr:sulfite exporter TauE/SafE family protein [Mucilaginibacter sp. MD40]PAW92661.1 hypothetical protein CKK33_03785 [Mucilaginibacter sp. MD40]